LGIDAKTFSWSKDLLNPASKPFAFYNWDHGFGFITPENAIGFDAVSNQVIHNATPGNDKADSAVVAGKSFMQEVYQQYMEY
jgi:hypothetical protein